MPYFTVLVLPFSLRRGLATGALAPEHATHRVLLRLGRQQEDAVGVVHEERTPHDLPLGRNRDHPDVAHTERGSGLPVVRVVGIEHADVGDPLETWVTALDEAKPHLRESSLGRSRLPDQHACHVGVDVVDAEAQSLLQVRHAEHHLLWMHRPRARRLLDVGLTAGAGQLHREVAGRRLPDEQLRAVISQHVGRDNLGPQVAEHLELAISLLAPAQLGTTGLGQEEADRGRAGGGGRLRLGLAGIRHHRVAAGDDDVVAPAHAGAVDVDPLGGDLDPAAILEEQGVVFDLLDRLHRLRHVIFLHKENRSVHDHGIQEPLDAVLGGHEGDGGVVVCGHGSSGAGYASC